MSPRADRTVVTGLQRPAGLALALVSVFVLARPASAHSLEEMQQQLTRQEQYFQALDKPAPDFTLRDVDGRTVALGDLRGKVVVLHFIYARCPDICPLHADRIAEVQEMVNGTPMKERVQFISITTDPAGDTADILRDYGPAHGLDPANWTFLTTAPDRPEDLTRRLAEAYGHKFSKTDGIYQVHGIVTHVIDQDGRWRANFHGLAFEPVNLVLFINVLTNEAQRPHGHETPNWWERLRDAIR